MAEEKRELTTLEKNAIHRLHPEYSYYNGPKQIYGPLYYVGDNTVSAHLLDTGDGLILMDSLYPQSVHVLLQQIWEAGFDPAEIRYILHTHVHLDHFGGTKPLVDMFGCRTFMSAVDADLLESGSPVTMLAVDSYPPLSETRLFHVDERLRKDKLEAKLLLQVHDELIVECPTEETEAVSRILKEEMESAASLSVPLTVEVQSGHSWGEAH